jgi:hypothetical protein
MCEADVVAVMAKLKRNLAPFNSPGSFAIAPRSR